MTMVAESSEESDELPSPDNFVEPPDNDKLDLQSAAAAAYDRAELHQHDEPSASDLDFVEKDEDHDTSERIAHEDFVPSLKSESSDEGEAESSSDADASEDADGDAKSIIQHRKDANSVEQPNDGDTNNVVHNTEYGAKRVARRNTHDQPEKGGQKARKKKHSLWQPSRSTRDKNSSTKPKLPSSVLRRAKGKLSYDTRTKPNI